MKETPNPFLRGADPGGETPEQPQRRARSGGSRDRLTSLRLHPEDGFGDRRKAVRQPLSGFAVIHSLDPGGRKGRYRVARLHDISTSGIGLCLNATDPDSFRDGREFEILFQFSEHGKPRHMTCTTSRHAVDETGLIVGAVFKHPLGSLAEFEHPA